MIVETRARIETPRLHAAQRLALRAARRFTVLACGRRWGKTTLATWLLVRAAAHGKPVAYFAPRYKLLDDVWRTIRRALAPITTSANDATRRIETKTGGVIEGWTLEDRDAGRSRKYALAIIDEAALVRDLDAIWHESIRPTLADLRGSAWIMSTPKWESPSFRDLFHRAKAGAAEWAALRFRSDDNPQLSRAELAAMRAALPERVARQELDAEFLDPPTRLFAVERLAFADTPPPGLAWTRGYDLAASTRTAADFSASIACAVDAQGRIWLRDGWRMRAEFPDVRRRIVETMRAEPSVQHVIEEALHGLAAIQDLMRDPALTGVALRGQRVDRDKVSRALALAARVEHGLVTIVRGAWINEWIEEMRAFPESDHDDYVDATTLAYNASAQRNARAAATTSRTLWRSE